MFNHQPSDYTCPFCELIRGHETEHNRLQDIVFQNDYTTATMAPKWWSSNPGHVLVIPNEHIENIYDMPNNLLGEIYKTVKTVAMSMRSTYEHCEGTSTRQHNEPAGNQDVWHFHAHVFPRYENDNLYLNHDKTKYSTAEERLPYAKKLRTYIANHPLI